VWKADVDRDLQSGTIWKLETVDLECMHIWDIFTHVLYVDVFILYFKTLYYEGTNRSIVPTEIRTEHLANTRTNLEYYEYPSQFRFRMLFHADIM
jgi:hypothetical protein